MAAKPLIGITTDYRSARKEHAALSFVAAGYYDGILASGGIPVILPPLEEEDDIVRAMTELLTDPHAYRAMAEAVNPYGDGRASFRIASTLERAFGVEDVDPPDEFAPGRAR